MRSVNFKPALTKSALAASVLLLASTAAFGQQTVNLTAGAAPTALPDGSIVPMWGYSCGGVTGTALAGGSPTCAALNAAANTGGAGSNTTSTTVWSPIIITVPAGQDLLINLSDNLTFASGANTIPTSLVILGQLGGGVGTNGASCVDSGGVNHGSTCTTSPDHTNAQPSTWPIAADGPAQPVTGVGTPPVQGPRVQSFGTEATVGAPASLCFGACGVAGALPLKSGTYLIQAGTHPSIQGPMGLYGILVVTNTSTSPATAYPAVGTAAAVTYGADVPLLFSEIDPVQNAAVNLAVGTAGFSETNVWSGLYGQCGNPLNANGSANPTYGQCYPPAVNYTPLYYLFNGRAFD